MKRPQPFVQIIPTPLSGFAASVARYPEILTARPVMLPRRVIPWSVSQWLEDKVEGSSTGELLFRSQELIFSAAVRKISYNVRQRTIKKEGLWLSSHNWLLRWKISPVV